MNRPCFFALVTFIGFGLLILYLTSCFYDFVSAQSSCCSPPTYPLSSPRFAPNSSVTVTISSAFTATERQSIITALADWNTANAANGSGVMFDLPPLTGETPVLVSGNQFIGYDPNRSGAENPMHQDGYAVMLLGTSIRTGGTPEGRAAYTRGMVRHEVGHTLELDNRNNCSPSNCSVMCTSSLDTLVITSCDNTAVGTAYPSPTPTPTPTPEGPCDGWGEGWFIGHDGVCVPPECQYCYDNGGSYCSPTGLCWTPIIVDIEGDGYDLTNALGGVLFRPDPTDNQIQTSWTATGSDDAFLVLDRNGNGTIDDGSELFGCASPQPEPPPGTLRNGFLALAELDKAGNGGNGDGKISNNDVIFFQLRLWQDTNHNGFSEPGELHTLPELGLATLDLDYRESRRIDQNGNRFRYNAKLRDAHGAQFGRWAWDVFLTTP